MKARARQSKQPEQASQAVNPDDPAKGTARPRSKQERLELMRAAREFVLEALREEDKGSIPEAGLLLAASQLYELLTDLDPRGLAAKVEQDPACYVRLIGVLARLSESGLKYERYRAEVAEHKAALAQHLAGAKKGVLTKEAIAEMEEALRLL